MFQQMLNSSIAVLTRPAVATFEEHERNNLGWALIYAAIGAVISAVLGAIGASVAPPTPPDAATLEQLEGTPFGDMLANPAAMTPSIPGAIISALTVGLAGFLIYLGIVFLIGRAFGGTGQFGELAYDISLFYTPLAVVNGLIGLIVSAVPVLGCLTWIVSLALFVYNLYLTYLGIQAGMNVPRDKALITMIIVAVIGLVVACVLGLIVGVLIAAVAGAANQ
ncbi:MAG: Yip1 family protein [Chloroflexota bacterium]